MAKKKKISREIYDSLVSNQKVQTNSNNVKKISQDDYSSLVSTTDRLNSWNRNPVPTPSTVSKTTKTDNQQKSFSFDINNNNYKDTGKTIGNYIKDSQLKDKKIYQKDNKFYYFDEKSKKYNEITNQTGYGVKKKDNSKNSKSNKDNKQIAPIENKNINNSTVATGKFEEPDNEIVKRTDKLGLADRLSVDFSGKSDEEKKKMESELVQKEKDNSRLVGAVKGLSDAGYIKAGALDDGYQFGDLTKTVGSTILSGFNSIGRGALGFVEGIGDTINYGIAGVADLLGQDNFADTLRDETSKSLVDEFTMSSSESILGENSILGEKSDSIAESIGGMLPSIALSGIAGTAKGATAVSSGSMFTSSYGQGVSEAYANGATDAEAQTYGLINGVAETVTEMMFGGLGKGSKALGISKSAIPVDDVLARTVSSKFKSKLAQNLTTAVVKSSGEGLEEVAAGLIEGIGKKLTFENDKELSDILNDEHLLDQFIGGAVASGIMQTPSLAKSTKQGRSLATNYTDNEQKVLDNVIESRFNEQVKDNPNMSKKEQNQLRSDIEEQAKKDLENGNLTPKEIQNALGNDDYQTYQNETKRKQALEKQLKELQSKSTTDMSYSEYNENNQKIADLQNQIDSINLDELKSKADTPVENRMQDNDYMLQRSYNNYQNNQAQKNVAFQYEPQTDSKGKEVKISDLEKNVYDSASKIMNNTKESHDLADFTAKLSKNTGVQYEFTTTEDLKSRGYEVKDSIINGLNTDDGKVLINIDSDSVINRVVGHETTHLFENTEDYKTLQNELFEYAKTKGDFDKLKSELTEAYKNVKEVNIDNELTSELAGQYIFSDTEFVQNLSKHRNIFQKVYDEIKHLYKMATAGSKEARQLEKVKRAFEKAYQNNEAKAGNTKYSLNKKLKKYTNKELENFKGGKIEIAKTTNDIDAFVNEELSKKTSNNKILFGKVSDEIATTISKQFGINIDNYSISLKGDNVRKIIKDHGNPETESKRGQIAVTKSDFDYIDDIILEPDNIYLSGTTSSGKPSITFEKNINNKYTLVEFVSDKNYTLEVQTMYKHKKKNSPTADNTQKSLFLTSETDSGSSSSIKNVSQSNSNVKSNTSTKYSISKTQNNTLKLEDRVSGNELLNAQDLINELSSVGANIDDNGYVTVYHATTPENAQNIIESGKMTANEPAVFFSTSKNAQQSEGRGGTTVEFRIPVEKLQLDDIFSDNADVKIPLDNYLNNSLDVSDYLATNNTKNSNTSSFSVDNQGNTLTKQQQEYFKDSKVRDKNGNLKVLYHGTPNEFTKFSYDFIGSNGTALGKGFYLTDNIDIAEGYTTRDGKQGQVMKLYANITKPMSLEEKTISKTDFKKFIEAVDKKTDNQFLSDYGDIDYEGYDNVLNTALDSYDYSDNDVDLIHDVLNTASLSWKDGFRLLKDTLGYDGVISDNVYIPVLPEQIKNVDNQNPTSDEDIRYSLNNDNLVPLQEGEIQSQDVRLENRPIAPLPTRNQASTQTSQNIPILQNTRERNTSNLEIEQEDDTLKIPIAKRTKPKIVGDGSPAQILDTMPEREQPKSKVKEKLTTKIVDRGYYVDKVARQYKKPELSSKYDYSLQSNGIANQIVGVNRTDLDTGEVIGKGLYNVFEPVEKAGLIKEFSEYMYHNLNIDRMTLEERYAEDNKPVFGTQVTADDSRQIVHDLERKYPEFQSWAKNVYDYNNANLDMMIKYGLISEKDKQYYNDKYPHYVPIVRTDSKNKSNYDIAGRKASVHIPIKKAKGGNQDLIPLKDAMATRTMQTVNSSLRNSFGQELYKTIYGEDVEMNEKANVDDIMESNDDNSIVTPKDKNKSATFTIFKDGKKTTFDISDEIYMALEPSKVTTLSIMNKFNNFRRGVLTEFNPTFMITNPVKDIQDGLINSKHPAQFIRNLPRALTEIVKKGDYYKRYIASGGSYETYFNYNTGTQQLSNVKVSGIKKVLKMPLDKVSALNNIIEMTPRMSEFISSLDSGDSIETAMYNAQEVTTNFKRGGDWTKTLDRNGFTFLNAGMQGFAKQIRNIQEANSKGVRGYANLMVKYAIIGAIPAILNNLLWGDDDDYEDVSDYVKDSYYLMAKDENGNFVRIPKGRVTSVLQKFFDNILRGAEGKDMDWQGFADLMQNQVLPSDPSENNLFSPLVQAITNEAWYGGDIVPTRLQDLPSKEQYDETTDSISIWLGQITGISPYKINYVLDQYSGFIGDYTMPYLTQEAESGSDTFLGNLIAPISDKFTVNSTMDNQNVSDFYDLSDELTKKSNSSEATDEDKLKYKYISSVSKEVSDLYAQKREIQSSDKKNSEKVKETEEIQKQIVDKVKSAMNNYEDIDIDGNYSRVADKEYYKNTKNQWSKIKDDELDDLNNIGMTSDDKNMYFTAKNSISEISSDDSLSSTEKRTEIGDIVINSGLDDEAKGYLYQKKYSNQDTIDVMINSQIPIDEFIKFNSQEFESQYDADGNTIKNSRKNAVIKYVRSLNLSTVQKAMLIKSEYASFDNYDSQIINYVNSLDLDFLDRAKIVKKFNFDNFDKSIINYVKNNYSSASEQASVLENLGFKVYKANGRTYVR